MSADLERIPGRSEQIGPGSHVTRLLPTRLRRRIGAWCFLDHFGPVPAGAGGMSVGPHPHVGLQTASWLFEGQIHHLDSVGFSQVIRPGQLNLMTAGRGIAHSEDVGESPRGLHGVQLWIALPDTARHVEPTFAHHHDLPQITQGGLRATLVVGELLGERSPAQVFTPLLMIELLGSGDLTEVPLRLHFEHGLVVVKGHAEIAGEPLAPGELLYLPPGRDRLALRVGPDARVILLGGEPFPETLLMGWNWVVRTNDELRAAHEAWARGEGHGDLSVFGDRPRVPAPPLRGPLKAR
ncbi:MAG: pirin family protein [Deltaproteobacteria bacterium]|nr:MAG: pirin family protein [Deltaproteobacteria bacterium]